MSMSMGCYVGAYLTQAVVQVASLSPIQWSLLSAYAKYGYGPPPYVEPTYEDETFHPRLKLKLQQIVGFEEMEHSLRMQYVDAANEVFRFAYTRGRDEDDEQKGFYKIPLLRNRRIMDDPEGIDRIKIRISRAEYERANAILEAVGELERIARAIPYYELYCTVKKNLRRQFKVGLDDVVLVSIDRGGRLPCIILQRALNMPCMFSLKVDQGGRGLDEDRLLEFVSDGTLRDKHVLFVDSTVDSGRQIRVLERYFDDSNWRARLGHRSWSIVGSNDYAENLGHHLNVNWGVDPDRTFEDNPQLMGIDYAPGSHTKVVDFPSQAATDIRRCLLAVPDGYIYTTSDIDEQLATQREKWQQRQKERRAEHRRQVATEKATHRSETAQHRQRVKAADKADRLDRELRRITSSKRWQALKRASQSLPEETLPQAVQNGQAHEMHNVLIVGARQQNLPQATVDFVADNLGPHCSLFAGTPKGNPGAVLKAVLASQKVPQPEVRLYQTEHMRGQVDPAFGNSPVVFVGPDKHDVRYRMIDDSHAVLALGGEDGTLEEVLQALLSDKPTFIISGYGPVAAYVAGSKQLRKKKSLHICSSVAEAVQLILDASKA
ncbi:MAG: hypothetical protein Q7S57_02030 [bacterium]|nr:hypothetical protein [bacterium]